MIEVDWGTLRPTDEERAIVHARLAALPYLGPSTMSIRRAGSRYEARLRMSVSAQPTEVRLQDEDIASAVDRLVQLLAIVARQRRAAAY